MKSEKNARIQRISRFFRLIAPLFAMNIFNFEEKFRERI